MCKLQLAVLTLPCIAVSRLNGFLQLYCEFIEIHVLSSMWRSLPTQLKLTRPHSIGKYSLFPDAVGVKICGDEVLGIGSREVAKEGDLETEGLKQGEDVA